MADSLDGLRRARARQAPKGYEGQSAWVGSYGGASDQALMALYRQRQQDRIDAENAERSQRMQQTGLWEPTVQNSFNMSGMFEGVQHNDEAAGIDPDTGEIVEGPKSVRMLAPQNATPSLPEYQSLVRIEGYDPSAASFSMQGLREIIAEKDRKKQKAITGGTR